MTSRLLQELYRTLTLGRLGEILALTTPVARPSQDLVEHAQSEVYDFKSAMWRYFTLKECLIKYMSGKIHSTGYK